MKDPVEIQPPGTDRVFIILRVIASGNRVPFTPLDDVSLDLVHSPDRELGEEVPRRIHRWFSLHRQFINRLQD